MEKVVGFAIFILFSAQLLHGSHGETIPCGSTVVGNSGELEYKLNEFYIPGERCTWFIHTNLTRFHFTKESSHFHNSQTTLSIHAFQITQQNGQDDSAGSWVASNGMLGQIEHEQTLFMEGTYAVVVFTAASGDNVHGRGFRLTYNATGTPISLHPVDKITTLTATNTTGTYFHKASASRELLMFAIVRPTKNVNPWQKSCVSLQIFEIVSQWPCDHRSSVQQLFLYNVTGNEANLRSGMGYDGISFRNCVNPSDPIGPYLAEEIIIGFLFQRRTREQYIYAGPQPQPPPYPLGDIPFYWEIY